MSETDTEHEPLTSGQEELTESQEWLTRREAQSMLGVSRQRVLQLVSALGAVLVAGPGRARAQWRYPRRAVEVYAARRERASAARHTGRRDLEAARE